jgi:hypothetical protein
LAIICTKISHECLLFIQFQKFNILHRAETQTYAFLLPYLTYSHKKSEIQQKAEISNPCCY